VYNTNLASTRGTRHVTRTHCTLPPPFLITFPTCSPERQRTPDPERRISDLPEGVLRRILSLLPAPRAVWCVLAQSCLMRFARHGRQEGRTSLDGRTRWCPTKIESFLELTILQGMIYMQCNTRARAHTIHHNIHGFDRATKLLSPKHINPSIHQLSMRSEGEWLSFRKGFACCGLIGMRGRREDGSTNDRWMGRLVVPKWTGDLELTNV